MGDHNWDFRCVLLIGLDLFNSLDDIEPTYHLTKDDVFAHQVRTRSKGDKPLSAVGIRAAVRHHQEPVVQERKKGGRKKCQNLIVGSLERMRSNFVSIRSSPRRHKVLGECEGVEHTPHAKAVGGACPQP